MFFNGSYNPHKNKLLLNLICYKNTKVYVKVIFKGDFDVVMIDNKAMEDFYALNNLESLIEKPRCYKNCKNPTCFDLILTNRLSYFHYSNMFKNEISDFVLLIATGLKIGLKNTKS